MKKRSNFIYFFVSFIFLSFVDFYYSQIITTKLLSGWRFSSKFINIIYAENTGAAFSIMRDYTEFLTALSMIAIVAIIFYVLKNLETAGKKEIFFLSFLAAGILGNFYERVSLGYVRDFFDIPFINFPIFNISDVFINIGVIGIIILILIRKKPIKLL